MHRAPTLLPLRRALAVRATAAASSKAAAAAGGARPLSSSSSSSSRPSGGGKLLAGPLATPRRRLPPPGVVVGARAEQSSMASSAVEPLPASSSASGAAEEDEEQQRLNGSAPAHHHAQSPKANGHHSHEQQQHAALSHEAATSLDAAVAQPQLEQEQQQQQQEAQEEPAPLPPPVARQLEQEATHAVYPGDNVLPFTSELRVLRPDAYPKQPVYRVLESDGAVREGALEPQLEQAAAVRMYGTMARLQAMDQIFYNAQRQGRISFYMTSTGEEATHIGSAAALQPTDLVLAQYREAGVLMWRGFTLEQFADQCFSNAGDLGKGRQMPVHYGTAALHFQTISSPLATQIPQAVGAAYGYKLEDKAAGRGPEERRCAVCYFGEGAASEGDFHAALNFAATLEAPVLFFCRNNGFAISTPVRDQFRGDGIVSRAQGYGVHALRVDGNDLLAVYNATRAAREVCVAEGKPVLVEAMTYRVGHHSTSDDSTRYRALSEIKQWQEAEHDPLARFRRYLERKGWWGAAQETQLRDAERLAVLRALEAAEGKPKPALGELFTDVYAEKPRHLVEQEAALHEHIAKYPEHYNDNGNGH